MPAWGPEQAQLTDHTPTRPSGLDAIRGLLSRIPVRTAVMAGVGAAIVFALLLAAPHIGGDDDNAGTAEGPQAAVTAAPAGATQIGPFAFVLPESAGPWTTGDTSDVAASIDTSQYPDGKPPELFQYLGGAETTGILMAHMPGGVTTIDGIEEGTANIKALLGDDTTVSDVTWNGSLPSRAIEVDGAGLHMVILYIELPDRSLVTVSANWDSTSPASAELTNSVLNATYTG